MPYERPTIESGNDERIEKVRKEFGQEYENRVKKWLGKSDNGSIDAKYRTGEQLGFKGFLLMSEKNEQGYPSRRKRHAEERKIADLQKNAEGRLRFGNPEDFKKFMTEHFDTIALERKIHLQPKTEYRAEVVERLARMILEDPDLLENINGFKVSTDEKPVIQDGKVLPQIVIYIHGKEKFERVLQKIVDEFHDLENYGNGLTPRENYKINELVYVAQSGGDFKEALEKKGMLDIYFDKNYNYAFRKGEKPPQVLDFREAKNFQELFKELNAIDTIQGFQREYESIEMRRLINKVRSGELQPEYVPRTGGLRNKVQKLLKS